MGALQDKINEILKEAGETIKVRAQQNLKDGNLKNSINYKLNKGKVEIIMAEYGIFQDQGVTGVGDGGYQGIKRTVHKSKGGFSFKNNDKKSIGGDRSIKAWMGKKGINPKAEFAIRRSIKQHGITLELEAQLSALHEEFYKDIEHGTNR